MYVDLLRTECATTPSYNDYIITEYKIFVKGILNFLSYYLYIKNYYLKGGRQNTSPTIVSCYITVGEGFPLPKKEKITAEETVDS